MTISKVATCIVTSVLVCGLVALGFGALLGRVAPGYDRAVFKNGADPDFDPMAVGVGLGLTQGLIVGVVIGCVIVFAVGWTESRMKLCKVESNEP